MADRTLTHQSVWSNLMPMPGQFIDLFEVFLRRHLTNIIII